MIAFIGVPLETVGAHHEKLARLCDPSNPTIEAQIESKPWKGLNHRLGFEKKHKSDDPAL